MLVIFTGVTYNGENVVSTSIIQKEMPDGWHILLSRNGGWVKVKNESLKFKLKQPNTKKPFDEYPGKFKIGSMPHEC